MRLIRVRARLLVALLVAGVGTGGCVAHDSGHSCLPEQLPAPATTTVEGREVFVVQALDVGSDAGACYTQVQVGPVTYVYTKDSDRRFRASELTDGTYAIGGPRTEEIVEVRAIRGVPPEFALAALTQAGGWVAMGGPAVEGTEMEDQPALAEVICGALEDRSIGWSFC